MWMKTTANEWAELSSGKKKKSCSLNDLKLLKPTRLYHIREINPCIIHAIIPLDLKSCC